MRIGGLAVLPQRFNYLDRVLGSLVNQLDHLHVVVNLEEPRKEWIDQATYHCAIHDNVTLTFANNERGDAMKFEGCFRSQFRSDFHYFTFDDDLEYPATYCDDMVAHLEAFENKVLVSCHGTIMPPERHPFRSYYANRVSFGCLNLLEDWIQVHFPGSGVSAFHSSTLMLDEDDFAIRNMADIWLGIACAKQNVPVICVPHQPGGIYLKYDQSLPIEETIWGQTHQDDSEVTRVVNDNFHLLPKKLLAWKGKRG